jgi:hypothetical protein
VNTTVGGKPLLRTLMSKGLVHSGYSRRGNAVVSLWYQWCYTAEDGWFRVYDGWEWWGPVV